jgi:hypothetical protein
LFTRPIVPRTLSSAFYDALIQLVYRPVDLMVMKHVFRLYRLIKVGTNVAYQVGGGLLTWCRRFPQPAIMFLSGGSGREQDLS